MKDKTKVKARNVGKVAEILTKDPNATIREIAEETGMAKNTVMKGKDELRQNGDKDPVIQYIVSSAKERIKRVSALFDRYVKEIEDKETPLERGDIALAKDIVKDDMARVTVLGGSVTDDDGGLKETPKIEIEIIRRTIDSIQ